MNQRAGQWLLLLATLLFAILGQLYFARRPAYFWDGVIFYVVAAVCLLVLARRPLERHAAPEQQPRTREEWARLALAVAGVALAALAVLRLRSPQPAYWPIFWTWLAGMALALASALPRPRELWAGARATVRNISPWEAAAVLALIIIAFLLRAWRIDSIPWTLSGDEGNFGRWARQVLTGEVTNMFSTGHLSMPSLYAFFQAAWLRLAGDNVFGLRLPWAFVGALSVFGAYLLVRRLFGRELALLTAVLLTGYSYHIHYSRLALNNIADPFFVVWALYFLVVGWQGGRRWAWMMSGLLAGLAFYFYTGGRQVAVIMAAVIVWAALVERDFIPTHGRRVLAMLLGFLVAVGPMALYAVQHPDDFNARFNQVGIIQSGWLSQVAQMEGKSELLVLAEQFRKVFFAFNHFLDNTDFYRPSTPLLDFPMSILFLLGVVLSVARVIDRLAPDEKRTVPPEGQLAQHPERSALPQEGQLAQHPEQSVLPQEGAESKEAAPPQRPRWRYAVFVIWFFGAIIAGGVLTTSAPSSQRILSSSIPAIFFVAVALREIVGVFIRLIAAPRLARPAIALAIAAFLALGSARYYFGPYQQSWVYGTLNGEVSTAIGHLMADLGPGWKQYFFGAPRMWAEFGSATFISKNPVYDAIEPLAGPPLFVDPQYNAAFIFLPERMADLDFVRQAYPGGELREVRRIGEPDGPVLFSAYLVTKPGG